MSILKVAHMGHPILRRCARSFERSELQSTAVQNLIDNMIETMREYSGVGLAGPQVHEGLRLFVAAIPQNEDEDEKEPTDADPMVFVNPVITPLGSDVVEDWEGCLSIPNVRGLVPRAREIRVNSLDRHGARLDLRLHDFPARVVQHETDHLDGILFLDRMRSLQSLTFLEEYSRYWAKKSSE